MDEGRPRIAEKPPTVTFWLLLTVTTEGGHRGEGGDIEVGPRLVMCELRRIRETAAGRVRSWRYSFSPQRERASQRATASTAWPRCRAIKSMIPSTSRASNRSIIRSWSWCASSISTRPVKV